METLNGGFPGIGVPTERRVLGDSFDLGDAQRKKTEDKWEIILLKDRSKIHEFLKEHVTLA
ncbi:MAG: hypothetical protein JW889_07890 [Verrucomicrobia bacterium]|nr:hypothetical protein [Verrucomicrobiota bacterium]